MWSDFDPKFRTNSRLSLELDSIKGILLLKFLCINLLTIDVDKNQPSLIQNGRNDGNPTRKLIQLWVQLSLRPEARIFAFFRKLLFPTLFSHLYKWMNEMAIAVLATTIYRDLQTIHHFDQSTLDYSWVKNTSHCLHIQSAISISASRARASNRLKATGKEERRRKTE